MKKINFLAMAGILSILLLPAASRAQEIKMLPSVIVTTASNVNQSVLKSFQGEFKNAMDPVWYRLDKNYLVKFMTADQKNTALFRNNGRLVYHISYGTEKNLPDEIRDKIMGSYQDYNITAAIHVNEANRSIWVVNLEGLKKLIVVRVEEGELEEVGNYVKG
ncbi:MAG: hypothetical protein BGO55_26390 [Sphingobacteriales bacterium 50-39]|nr:hypothetical protein [Sphingobacteriales bacterium]OJW56424.1 MAG: hypothetical protein BGO55_26390 [Sphingobacteriales bacterium 50-39]